MLDNAYENIEDTFIVADAIKVSPILKSLGGNKTYEAFFPHGQWVDLDSYEVLNVTDKAGSIV